MTWGAFWEAVTQSESARRVPSELRGVAPRRVRSTPSSASSSPGCWCVTAFPGRRLVDAMVDLPFAMPTAVAGIALTALYAPTGWIGRYLDPLGIRVAFTPLGVMTALTFIGLPFVVRTVQPVLQDMQADVEEAAASLGADRWADAPQGHLPRDPSRAPHRLRPRLRAGARRVRLGGLHLRQPPDAHGDRDPAHHGEARAVRLRGSDRDRERAAGRVFRSPSDDQSPAVVDPPRRVGR